MTIYNDKASKFYRMDTMIIPYIVPVDRHDKMAVFEAICFDVPKGFSNKAKAFMEYLDDTAFIFEYKGKLILTDESLYLTAYGDGINDPIGGPRWEGYSWDELEKWLEMNYDEMEAE